MKKRMKTDGEQNLNVEGVSADSVPVSNGNEPRGVAPMKNEKDEEFCQRVSKGERPFDVYHLIWPKVPPSMVVGLTGNKLSSCKDRIDYLTSLLTEEEKKWTTWTKEESTKELKHIVADPDVADSVRIKAITELNTMYQHNNPKASGLTIENKGIVFMARDGIALSSDFFAKAKEAIAAENSKFIDVTPEKKELPDGNK